MQIPEEILKRCWFLAGPTAVGKTAVGIELAKRIDAEIVCLDSMTLYRGMDIGTAKATAQERAQVPHHLLDVIEPHEEFSVAEYLAAAKTACEEILARGRTPLFVGGTGLYLRSVLRGVFQGPPADWTLRERLESAARERGEAWLHDQLAQVDPETANRLHPRDLRRVIRAMEVYELSGKPLSEQQRQPALASDQRPAHVFWLSPPRNWLYERIDQRVEAMFAGGFLAEVRHLQQLARPMGRTAWQALGYKEVLDWLDATREFNSAEPPSQVIREIQTRTRQFAKRQHTWFRNLEECRAVEIDGTETAVTLAEKIAAIA